MKTFKEFQKNEMNESKKLDDLMDNIIFPLRIEKNTVIDDDDNILFKFEVGNIKGANQKTIAEFIKKMLE